MMDLGFTEGEQAFDDDQGYADNPYKKGSPLWHRWLEGYRHAEMNANQLTAYREAASAAKHLAMKCGTHNVLSLGISKIVCEDIPTLATAVVELCSEVERLQKQIETYRLAAR